MLGLFRHILTTSSSTFNGQFYGQTDGVALGTPFSPVITNFYMEDYEKAAHESAPLKPSRWFCYVEDTFVEKKNGIFWDVTPCGSCKNRRFIGT
jgi:hypothetical protein